jgi:hypothetical protein
VVVATLAAAIAFGRAAIAWRVVLVALYVIPFLTFTNVQWVHHYYQYANALFVVMAVAIVAYHSSQGWRRWVAYALVTLTLACQLLELVRVEWPQMTADQSKSNTILIRRYLRRLPADGVVLVFGYDWSSEIAYYSKHRAITVPMWASRAQLESLRDQPGVHSDGHPIVGVVVCSGIDPSLAQLRDAILAEHTRNRAPVEVGSCTLWRGKLRDFGHSRQDASED